MSLKEKYPREWDELTNKKVPQKEIDKYLLKFVARLLREVKEGKRNEDDLGDGFGMGIMMASDYQLSKELKNFLMRLSSYGMGPGDTEYGPVLQTPEEVETELKKVARKFGVTLNL